MFIFFKITLYKIVGKYVQNGIILISSFIIVTYTIIYYYPIFTIISIIYGCKPYFVLYIFKDMLIWHPCINKKNDLNMLLIYYSINC